MAFLIKFAVHIKMFVSYIDGYVFVTQPSFFLLVSSFFLFVFDRLLEGYMINLSHFLSSMITQTTVYNIMTWSRLPNLNEWFMIDMNRRFKCPCHEKPILLFFKKNKRWIYYVNPFKYAFTPVYMETNPLIIPSCKLHFTAI